MGVTFNLGATLKSMEDSLQAAYRDGYQAGYAAAVATMVDRLQGLAPAESVSVVSAGRPASNLKPDIAGERQRAPRGALDRHLDTVLAETPGMTTQQIERTILDRDQSIAFKSIYSRLRFFEKNGRKFRRQDGLWYRVQDIPAPWAGQGSPKGEAGGGAPPASAVDL